ncbi:dihydrofolate reductase family protein [Sphingomonas sp.]|uniref:dihydrofolate reductase family protein n=1 Tax=Sphingomonas sp. TaxID=28214 RepID=UPI003D6D620A
MSATLFAMISVSLDGFIEDEAKAIDWMTEDRSIDALHTQNLREIEAMVFGRTAHAAIAGYWQQAEAGSMAMTPDLVAQTERMTSLPKYVLTHGPEQTGWANSHAVDIDRIKQIKAQSVQPVAVFAGAGAIQSVLTAGLIDELRLIVYPVSIGGGTPLFPRDRAHRQFELTRVEQFESGAILQCYRLL